MEVEQSPIPSTLAASNQSSEWQVQIDLHLFDKMPVLTASFNGSKEIIVERISSGSSTSQSSPLYKVSKIVTRLYYPGINIILF